MPLRAFVLNQGPFPPPPLRGFHGTTDPSAICRSRRWPSRVRRCPDGRLGRLPLLHIESFPCVLPPLPRWNRRRRFLVSPSATAAFPVIVAGRLPHRHFRGLLGVHCALQPARPADSLRSRFLECFSPFVTSWTAPSTSGWDEHRRSGFTPEDSMCLRKAHTTTKARTRFAVSASDAAIGSSWEANAVERSCHPFQPSGLLQASRSRPLGLLPRRAHPPARDVTRSERRRTSRPPPPPLASRLILSPREARARPAVSACVFRGTLTLGHNS